MNQFELRTDILPKAQQELWPLLAPAPSLSFVLYRGTAVALYLGHRVSVDFDFFRSARLDKKELDASFAFIKGAKTIQEDENSLVVIVAMPSGPVKVSFFGGIAIGRINDPLRTNDSTLLVASVEDISAMLSAHVSLEKALGAFAKMYGKDPGLPLRAIGFFKDGDLPSLPKDDQERLRAARDRVSDIPDITLTYGSLAATPEHGKT
jgi:hypothetical protein